jgi:hypothetical protein
VYFAGLMPGAWPSFASGSNPDPDVVALALAIIDEESANWSSVRLPRSGETPPEIEAAGESSGDEA